MTRPPFRVRASSWGQLFNCAHAWEGVHILGMRKPAGPRALIGTAIHEGTAFFDTARMIGSEVEVFDAAQIAVDAVTNPEADVDWKADDLTKKDAAAIVAILVTKYCQDVSPRYTFAAVEMETKPLVIDCGGGVQIELTGTLDRSRIYLGSHGKGISDLKSGSAAVENGRAKTKGHAPQIGTYELLFEHSTGEAITEPGEIIGLKTSGKPEIGFGQIVGARELMLGTEDEPGLIQYAANMFRTGMFPPNTQTVLCSEKFCPRWARCRFHD